MGNNLNCLLPAELALLATPVSEKIFLQRYMQKRLQIFSSASLSRQIREKSGPVYICVDTSGSMSGKPEVVAKTLALAIAIIAQREKRPVCMVNYSFAISFFVLTNLPKQRRRFLAFLSNSYDDGNDEDLLFRFLFDILPTSPRYRCFANMFRGADLLVISDFIWSDLQGSTRDLLRKARLGGMKFYALGISCGPENVFFQECNCRYGAENEFFRECDYRYVYDDGRCFKYKPKEMP